MKLLLLAIFVAAAVASPIPDDDGNIDVIVNGVPEGEALDISHIVEVHTQEKVNGQVVATSNVLHAYTAEGIAEIAAAAEAEAAELEVVNPEPETPSIPHPVILPEPIIPEVNDVFKPEYTETNPEILPEPISPDVIPDPITLPDGPAPVVVPAEVLPTPVEVIDVVEETESIQEPLPEPVPAAEPVLQTGEIFNNGVASISVNAQEPTLLSTLQNWFNLVVQYISSDNIVQTTQVV